MTEVPRVKGSFNLKGHESSTTKHQLLGDIRNRFQGRYIRRPLGKGERAWELWCQMRSNGASNLWIAWFGHETCWGSRSAKGFGSSFSYIVRGRCFAWFRHESCCCSAVSQAVRQRLWTQRFWKLIQRHCSPNAFRRQHFGIVRGRCFAWFRHESCCCSAVAQAVRQRLRTLVFDVWHFIAVRHRFWKLILRLMRFVGNVSALFVVAVSHGFWCLTFHSGPLKVLEAHSAPNAFRKQRFGIVRWSLFRMVWTRILLLFGSQPFFFVFSRFGHESCCCSAVSQAVRQRLWTLRFWKLIQRHCSPFDVWHFIAVRHRFWKLILRLNAFRRQRFGIVRGRCFAWFLKFDIS